MAKKKPKKIPEKGPLKKPPKQEPSVEPQDKPSKQEPSVEAHEKPPKQEPLVETNEKPSKQETSVETHEKPPKQGASVEAQDKPSKQEPSDKAHERPPKQEPSDKAHGKPSKQEPSVKAHERPPKQEPSDKAHGKPSKQEPSDKAHEKPKKRNISTKISTNDKKVVESTAQKKRAQVTQEHPSKIRNLLRLWAVLKHLSILQKVLAFSIIIITAMLLYALLKPPKRIASHTGTRLITPQRTSPKALTTHDLTKILPTQVQKQQLKNTPVQPLSIKVAQDFYLQKNYSMAYDIYNQLEQDLVAGNEADLLRDFLQFKMALCIKKIGDDKQANRLLKLISESNSPILRILANYHISLIEIQNEQYLKARTRAYKTLALIGAVDLGPNMALLLQRNCHFTIAESVTRYVLSLCDIDKEIPDQMWSQPEDIDPFYSIYDTYVLNELLNSGSEQLSKGLLSPQIQKIEHPDAPIRWSLTCHWTSIEEVLARFAANAELEIIWTSSKDVIDKVIKDAIRNRALSLYLPAATTRQTVTTAAGCVGLLAQLDEQGRVNIHNPDEYSSLTEFTSLLSREAISLWQRFLLSFYDDRCVPNAHFALGLLKAKRGQFIESIAEYKLVANRYSQTHLAPFALLQSSKIKSNLRDYLGAGQDLKHLIEQYPDSELSGQACLYLAETSMKGGLLYEAARLYRKVYNLGLSRQSQTVSAFGAAKCFYEIEDYEAAAKWLNRYINLSKYQTNRERYLIYLLLGKTNLNLENLQQACNAFQYALTGELSKEEYIETVSALIEAQIKQEHFIEALTLIDSVHPWQFSQKESIEILLIKSKILRTMGLVNKAVYVLGERVEYIQDTQLKTKLYFELSKCYIAQDNLELALRALSETLIFVEPGPLSHEIALELADVCLKLGEHSQTITLCLQLLDSNPSSQIKQKALSTLAAAYYQQKKYDKATLAFLGRYNELEPENEKGIFVSPDAPSQLLNIVQ